MPLLLVRHAWAGKSEDWSGDDRLRPLDARGRAQAEALVEQLASYAVARVLSSPALRCRQTVEPLAAALGLAVELRDELSEDRQDTDGLALVRELAPVGDAVVCGHGGLECAVPDAPGWKKGTTIVVGPQLEVLATL